MLKSEICELLDIKYPIFQGGMAWIADGKLTAAVSEGGGLGIIAAGNAPADYVREQIQIARSLTNKPIGVNIMLLSPFAEEVPARSPPGRCSRPKVPLSYSRAFP